MKTSLNIDLTFRLERAELPTIDEQYGWLWQFACSLQKAGLPLDQWYPPNHSPEASLLNKAFDTSGPTGAALALAKADSEVYPGVRGLGAWNGIEGPGGAAITDLLTTNGVSTCELASRGIEGLLNEKKLAEIMIEATRIWPASSIQAGPYKYFVDHQVFEKRPGAGWMLYLPRVITTRQVPEARDLIPVMQGKQQKGTIIVSVIGEPFSVENPEHLKVANAIETRLADQDLLPLFTEL
ncbi:hypothetical protein AWB64_02522 [Caballeronia sordidicola]|uniref:Uncharacterized protein n=1 Tax=Caballeronia sordidicola TaxID=196367 RepID=A0A158GBZ6_CABSO|nr:immunity 52 family protein [Caballeronia sordidicola]SAL29542.1 hypothetical protein AWB64_02522 [Caballeronia sordidicola]